MEKLVFISHSKANSEQARKICELLEQDNIGCYIAPRDINYGEDWAGSIAKSIKASKLFVFLLSEFSNDSRQCLKEVNVADNHNIPMLCVGLEMVQLNDSLEYHFSARQIPFLNGKDYDMDVKQAKDIIKQRIQKMNLIQIKQNTVDHTYDQDKIKTLRQLGYNYLHGFMVEKNEEFALSYFKKASDLNDWISKIEIAKLKIQHEQDLSSINEAVIYAQKAYALMFEEGIQKEYLDMIYEIYYKAARSYQYKHSMNQEAFDLYVSLYIQKYPKVSIYNLGWLYFVNKRNNVMFEQHKNTYIEQLKDEATTSSKSQCAYLLGWILEEGIRYEKNKNEALKWYLIAHDKGDQKTYLPIGKIYIEHYYDYSKGLDYLLQGDEKQIDGCTYLLGYYYLNNNDLKDIDKALFYLKKASDRNHKLAIGALGRYYYFDLNDYEVGKTYLNKGMQLDSGYCYYLYGFIYHYGRGVNVDKVIAKQYYEKAVTLGNKDAQKELKKL